MSTKLFKGAVFGPIVSRRLGISLGVNLLPSDGKLCSFDCIYCECGYNSVGRGTGLPTREEVKEALQQRLAQMSQAGEGLDVITFAGNGEPTIHPQFEPIIADTIALRDHYYPNAKISVLSNSTQLHRPEVVRALKRVDNNILKLDAITPSVVQLMNVPNSTTFSIPLLITQLKAFKGEVIIQTMFLRGTHLGEVVDNTTPAEVELWLAAIKEIQPKQVMIYSLDRPTPEKALTKVDRTELLAIAARVEELGIATSVA